MELAELREVEEFVIPSIRSFGTKEDLFVYAREEGIWGEKSASTPTLRKAWDTCSIKDKWHWNRVAIIGTSGLLSFLISLVFLGGGLKTFIGVLSSITLVFSLCICGAAGCSTLYHYFQLWKVWWMERNVNTNPPNEEELVELIQGHHNQEFNRYKESLIGDESPVVRENRKLEVHQNQLDTTKQVLEAEIRKSNSDDPEDAAFLEDAQNALEKLDDEKRVVKAALDEFVSIKESLSTVVAKAQTAIDREKKYADKRQRRQGIFQDIRNLGIETEKLLTGSREELFQETLHSLTGLAGVVSRVRAVEGRHLTLLNSSAIEHGEGEVKKLEQFAIELREAVRFNGKEFSATLSRIEM